MEGIMIDTNILVDWLKGMRSSRPKTEIQKQNTVSAINLINNFIDNDIEIFISCHTVKELLQYKNISAQEEERILTKLPDLCTILETNLEIAKTAGLLTRHHQEYKDHIEDCYIASTALVYNLPLYTRNPKDFRYIDKEQLQVNVPY